MELDEYYEEQKSKLNYFDKFKGMKPYFKIDEKEWTYIKYPNQFLWISHMRLDWCVLGCGN